MTARGSMPRCSSGSRCCAGSRARVEPLPGGLTNKNYKVSTPGGTYVVRHSTPASADELAVDRRAEYENSVRAAAAGVGAPVVEFLPDDGILVIGFLEGETLSDEHLQAPGMLPRVAEACRRLHAGAGVREPLRHVRAPARVPGAGRSVGAFASRPATSTTPRPSSGSGEPWPSGPWRSAPCHNDLLAANFIDDGRTVSIIDYEYSGNNDPYFELGNIWSECHLTLDQLEELVEAYDGTLSRSHLARARLWGLMSQYGWTLWASIQDGDELDRFRLLGLGDGEVRAGRGHLRAGPTSSASWPT